MIKLIRTAGLWNLKICKIFFLKVGIYPIVDHYYEPLFNPKHLRKSLRDDRNLPGIDFNIQGQLELLNNFSYNDELVKIPLDKTNDLEFYYHNESFESGDAEYLYNVIRFFKPSKIIEIGSGHSTLMAIQAITRNKKDDDSYKCDHICIEPYEMNWLERTNVTLIREKVECIDINIFKTLQKNDILFIDSSHMIRPQGDVLFECLEILPILNSGVLIHFHDIFTPKDYLKEWIVDLVRFWNEQYLLEAFLTNNKEFEIIGAVNFLKHNYPNELFDKCPILKYESDREPGSFWIRKV